MRGKKPEAKPPNDEADGGPLRIRAIAELTGVPEPTLRAWERRYGIPTPERTPAGYRLYGPREVRQVRTMQRLCAEGMAAAEAARAIATGAVQPTTKTIVEGETYAAAVEAILDAVNRFDDVALDRELRRAMFIGPSEAIADRVILPALERIGAKWHAGELTVAQEHFASHRLGTTMRDLVRLSLRDDAAVRTLVACFADEQHEIGALVFALHLATWGLRPVYLGARTPPSAIAAAIAKLSPRLVGLSVSVSPTRARARELVDGYAEACGNVPWIVGGAASHALGVPVQRAGGLIAPRDTASIRAMVSQAVEAHPAVPGSRKRGPAS